MVRSALIAMSILAAGGGAYAQDIAPPQAPAAAQSPLASQIEDRVVVRGKRMSEIPEQELEDVVSDFVAEVARPPRDSGYARWQRRVCIGVYNLEPEPAQYIIDRVSLLALDVGLNPGDPGCAPEVFVVFTTDAQTMAADMVENHRRVFRPFGGATDMQLGIEAMDNFAATDAPVRWWHVSIPKDRLNNPAIRLNSDPWGEYGYSWDGGGGGSRIYRLRRDDLLYAVIMVDATQVTDVTWEELGDYVAFISLAQVNPQAEPGAFDSILNLFDNPEAYTGLTDWDRNYLRALYSFDQYRQPEMQHVYLVNEMARKEESESGWLVD